MQFLKSLLVLASLWTASPAVAQFALFQAAGAGTVDTSCQDGQGGGQFLREANIYSPQPPICWYNYYVPGATGGTAVSTADAAGMSGLYWVRPNDLSRMGQAGAGVIAREGKQYAWITSPDHPSPGAGSWGNATNFVIGYSRDPGILPTTWNFLLPGSNLGGNQRVYTAPGGTGDVTYSVYQIPYLIWNPDAAPGDEFWIYAEGSSSSTTGTASAVQHQTGLFTSSDLSGLATTTLQDPPWKNTTFSGWQSFQRPWRVTTGEWYSTGFCQANTACIDPGIPGEPGMKLYTSPDGVNWTATGSVLVHNIGTTRFLPAASDFIDIGGQLYQLSLEDNHTTAPNGTCDPSNPNIGSWATLVPVDSNYNVISSPPKIRISDRHWMCYPGPTQVQGIAGYEESRILHVFVTRGYPTSGLQGTTDGPYNGNDIPFSINASAASGTLTVNSVTGTIVLGSTVCMAGCSSPASGTISAQLDGTPGGAGHYTISNAGTFTTASMLVINTGGLWQQFVDHYSYILDPAVAATAAPFGLKASAAFGVVTLTWSDALPNSDYRVYRCIEIDTSCALLGDVVGGTYIDRPITHGRFWYRIATLESGVERGSRYVDVYVSIHEQVVNEHINRVIADGGDLNTINIPYLAKAYQKLVEQDAYKYVMYWAECDFGYKRDSSGNTIKIYSLGATRMPIYGDFTPTTTNTACNPVAINGTAAGWINGTSNAFGYFGNGRLNNIQRKIETTVIALYQKPNTNTATLIASGQAGRGLRLQHLSGSPGNVSFTLTNNTPLVTSTASLAASSATGVHVAAGVYDGTDTYAYVDGVQSSPASTPLPNNSNLVLDSALKGQTGQNTSGSNSQMPFLGSGSESSVNSWPGVGYVFHNNQAQFSVGALMMFEKGFNQAQINVFTEFLQEKILIPAVQFNVADYGGCSGTNDAAAFVAMKADIVAWQATNTGLVQVNLPAASTCAFPSGNAAVAWPRDIKKLHVNGNGATLDSMSTGGFFLAGLGLSEDDDHSARTQTVLAGESCVTLVNPAQDVLFPVGRWANMTGFTIQGGWKSSFGYPPNWHFFEYKKIASSAGGVVCFTTPLGNTYKSTWPLYADGANGGMDMGGPATLYILPASWDTEVTYKDLTIDWLNTGSAALALGHTARFINVTVNGPNGMWPTQQYDWRFINSTAPTSLFESDKLITYMTMIGSSLRAMNFQSSSIDQMQVTDSAFTLFLNGTPKRFIAYGTQFASFRPGATAYGRSDWVLCVKCDATAFQAGGVLIDNQNLAGNDIGVNQIYSMSGGVIQYPNGSNVTGMADNGSGAIRLEVVSTSGFFSTQSVGTLGVFSTGGGTGFDINVIDSTHVDLIGSTFAGATWTGGGVISSDVPRWAVPGSNLIWTGPQTFEGLFQTGDVTQDAANVYIETSLPGGFPTLPTVSGGRLYFSTHPAPAFRCVDCTGQADFVATNAAPPWAPLFSYKEFTYDGSIGSTTQPNYPIWGELEALSFNVTQPYVGAGTQVAQLSAFNNVQITLADGSASTYGGRVDAKTAGERIVTATGVTGGQATDCGGTGTGCLVVGQAWWASLAGFQFSANVSAVCSSTPANCPEVTVTWRMNQGVVIP